METIRWLRLYCCEYHLLAYIVNDKLTIKHQTNQAEFEKEHGFLMHQTRKVPVI